MQEPESVKSALSQQVRKDAMKAEMDYLGNNDIWELVELPKDQKLVGSKWVFKVKIN